jgi:tripartite-type tricarboxylate transporter receptor subunit TctC
MTLSRRQLLGIVASLAAGGPLAATRPARAQAYPSRPTRLVVGYAPGGGNDILARLIAQWLAERLGAPFVVENRPGAATNVATEAVVNAPADGYTLLLVSPGAAINATLYRNLTHNFLRDIAPVCGLATVPNVMVVAPSFPAKTVPEFIAYAKANPNTINMASSGTGSSNHVSGELFRMMTGASMLHVPYRGAGPALTDLLGGRVQVMFATMPASLGYIQAGTLRPLGLTTAERSDALPSVPTIGEFVPGYEASQWYGVGAPRNTPPEIIATLNREINAALSDPKIKARITELGGILLAGPPRAFGKLIADETEKWAKVVAFSGLKPE